MQYLCIIFQIAPVPAGAVIDWAVGSEEFGEQFPRGKDPVIATHRSALNPAVHPRSELIP
jgi:hypothetical protein